MRRILAQRAIRVLEINSRITITSRNKTFHWLLSAVVCYLNLSIYSGLLCWCELVAKMISSVCGRKLGEINGRSLFGWRNWQSVISCERLLFLSSDLRIWWPDLVNSKHWYERSAIVLFSIKLITHAIGNDNQSKFGFKYAQIKRKKKHILRRLQKSSYGKVKKHYHFMRED